MSERFVIFIESKDTCNLYDEETHCFYEIHDSARNVDIFCERLNELVEDIEDYQNALLDLHKKFDELEKENSQLKEHCDALQKKTEMDKNDFFISEAKRMRLLAFIEDNGLRKEYSKWERRIWDE